MTCEPSNDKAKLGHPHNLIGLRCTKCSVDVNFQNLDLLSFFTRFNYNNSGSSSVGFIFCLNWVKHCFCNFQIQFDRSLEDKWLSCLVLRQQCNNLN